MSTQVARPTEAALRPLAKCQTIGEAFQSNEFLQRLRQAVPAHLNPERMLRVLTLSVHKTPALARAPVRELLGAMFTLAALGLEPNTPLGLAYLIPFKKRRKDPETGQFVDDYTIQVVIGYRGYIDLARRSGTLVSIHADVVYPGDEFDFEYGSRMHLRHKPGPARGGDPIYAYAHVKLKDGEAFEVLPYAEVLKIRDNSEGYKYALTVKNAAQKWQQAAYWSNPWVAFEHEMSAKTMIRRVSKTVPMSIEFANAAQLDSANEGGRFRWDTAIDVSSTQLDEIVSAGDEGDGQGDGDPPADTQAGGQRQIEGQREAAMPAQQRQPEPATADVRRETRQAQQPAQEERRAEPERSVLVEPRPLPNGKGYDWLDWQTQVLKMAAMIGDPADLARFHQEHTRILADLKKADISRYDAVVTALKDRAMTLMSDGEATPAGDTPAGK